MNFKSILSSLALLLLVHFTAFAQPSNDECNTAIDLGVLPYCPDIEQMPFPAADIFTNVDATMTDPLPPGTSTPFCFNGQTNQNDVWFTFTTSDTIFDYTFTLTGVDFGPNGEPIQNPQIAIYRGDCTELAYFNCASSSPGDEELVFDIEGMTPNETYYMMVNDYSASAAPNWGDFVFCIDEKDPINLIPGESSLCTGELYDSGGPDGDYMNDENGTFVICPSTPSECITFTLEYYNIQAGFGDAISFYDGSEVNPANVISTLDGQSGGAASDGAVCYQVQATSGCLTVHFQSDANVTYEGFAGSWECSTQACEGATAIVLSQNPEEIEINETLKSGQTVLSNIEVNCPSGAYALFNAGDNSELGLEEGIVLTSGDVNLVGLAGNTFASIANGVSGDADLDTISQNYGNGSLSNDACIVELDVYAGTDEISFEYVFGSEEYPEFVNSAYNDIFAFLISGPGIVGDPLLGNQLNIATLPGSGDLVEINSVNPGQNWEYYRNNEDLGQSVVYDGLTSDYLGVKKSLTARADVTPCNTYHLKLAVADRGDSSYDSGVFIGKIEGGTIDIFVRFNSGFDYLVEGCIDTEDEVVIELSEPLEETTTFTTQVGGTATQNVDYILNIPPTITFPAGITELSFPITVLTDMEDEITEEINIKLFNDFGCGPVEVANVIVELRDELRVDIQPDRDSIYVCAETGTIDLSIIGAQEYVWTPTDIITNINPGGSEVTIETTTSQWLTVTGTAGTCSDMDSIYLNVIDPQLELVTVPADAAICQGDSLTITALNNVDGEGLTWQSFSFPPEILEGPIVTVYPQFSTTYEATIDIGGCVVTDEVNVTVDQFTWVNPIEDTLICQGYPVELATNDFIFDGTTYEWSPTADFTDPTEYTPIVQPVTTTTYTVVGTSVNGTCTREDEVVVTVQPASVQIVNQDTTYICLGDELEVSANTSSASPDFFGWSASPDIIGSQTATSFTITPQESGTIYAHFELDECVLIDSIFVKVDSLPDSPIMATPDKAVYCQGDTVIFSSPTYIPAHFPEMEFEWLAGPGYQSPEELWNMVLVANETYTYQRVISNNACIDTSEITIDVLAPPTMHIMPPESTICPGSEVQLQLVYDGEGSITWSPAAGLSCNDCLDPIASPAVTTTYVATDDTDCPVSTSAIVNVEAATFTVTLDVTPTSLYSNNTIVMTANVTPTLTDAMYTWYFAGNEVGTTTEPTFTYLVPGNTPSIDEAICQVLVVDGGGCDVIAQTTIEILAPERDIPNVFSPNGDGINDVFKVYKNAGNPITSFRIYSRWGELVYEGNNDDAAWDGTYKDKNSPSDVYIYYVEFENGEKEEGEVTLIRSAN